MVTNNDSSYRKFEYEGSCAICWDQPKNKDNFFVSHGGNGDLHPLDLYCAKEAAMKIQQCPVCFIKLNTDSLFTLKERSINKLKSLGKQAQVLIIFTGTMSVLGTALGGIVELSTGKEGFGITGMILGGAFAGVVTTLVGNRGNQQRLWRQGLFAILGGVGLMIAEVLSEPVTNQFLPRTIAAALEVNAEVARRIAIVSAFAIGMVAGAVVGRF
jgi:hypothetical protein